MDALVMSTDMNIFFGRTTKLVERAKNESAFRTFLFIAVSSNSIATCHIFGSI
ncbi:MAG: hypothetical protein GKC03_09605 [Methanomassiliicoccales archaeon]|nr:hypothetical protein [Methanomassiliicoccales archaeon]NYT15448.1 hypothetical protein [Methanomassiliicoccales archaeon]